MLKRNEKLESMLIFGCLGVFLAFGPAACSNWRAKDDVATARDAELTDKTQVLEQVSGRYQSKPDFEIGRKVGGIGCTIKEAVFNGTDVTLKEIDYADRSCKGKVLGEIWTMGTAEITQMADNSPRTYHMDVTITSTQIVPRDAQWARVMKSDQSGSCRLSQLERYQAYDVAGLDCKALGKFPSKGDVFYTALEIDKNMNLELTKFPYEAPKAVGAPDERLSSPHTTFYRQISSL